MGHHDPRAYVVQIEAVNFRVVLTACRGRPRTSAVKCNVAPFRGHARHPRIGRSRRYVDQWNRPNLKRTLIQYQRECQEIPKLYKKVVRLRPDRPLDEFIPD